LEVLSLQWKILFDKIELFIENDKGYFNSSSNPNSSFEMQPKIMKPKWNLGIEITKWLKLKGIPLLLKKDGLLLVYLKGSDIKFKETGKK
jgi:hypothetical protein